MTTKFVGFCGPRLTGKDTTVKAVFAVLQAKGYSARTDYFARPMYEVMSILTGKTVAWLENQTNKNVMWNEDTAPMPCLVGVAPRYLMQRFGTEYVRNTIDHDFWIEHIQMRAKSYEGLCLVSDTRFENEAEICDLVIEVRREGIDYTHEHASECGLPSRLIDVTFWLTPGMSYEPIADYILTQLKEIK